MTKKRYRQRDKITNGKTYWQPDQHADRKTDGQEKRKQSQQYATLIVIYFMKTTFNVKTKKVKDVLKTKKYILYFIVKKLCKAIFLNYEPKCKQGYTDD